MEFQPPIDSTSKKSTKAPDVIESAYVSLISKRT